MLPAETITKGIYVEADQDLILNQTIFNDTHLMIHVRVEGLDVQ